jgi:hypothetical protein
MFDVSVEYAFERLCVRACVDEDDATTVSRARDAYDSNDGSRGVLSRESAEGARIVRVLR